MINFIEISGESVKTVSLKTSNKWCGLFYPRHKRGCPNVEACRYAMKHRYHATQLFNFSAPVYIVWVEFDLEAQARRMKKKHPDWSPVQCRNLLYWQRGVDGKLGRRIEDFKRLKRLRNYHSIIEGYGINVYATCRKAGLKLDRMDDMKQVRKLGILMKRIT